MRWAFLLTGFAGFAMIAAVPAADFPPPDKLPSKAEFPDPLLTLDGKKITTKDEWNTKRKPELKQLFQHYMYGQLPPPAKITATVEREDKKFFGGKATLKLVTIAYGPPDTPKTHVLLVIPNDRKKPAPVFVGMNFTGNHMLVTDPNVPLPTVWMYPNRAGVKDNKATEEGRGKDIATWSLESTVERGYAVATFYSGDVDPDRADKREGITHHIQPPPPGGLAPDYWGTVATWAWGIHRVVDYLVTDKDLDKEKIIVVGHSRLGKTALLAAAMDERIAMSIPHQAGCGGTAPNRQNNPKAESVARINTSFPHWFCGNFKLFNNQVDRLPFDQHCLVALCAPRPVLFTNAVEDQWANPDGQFQMLQGADPVYRLLGAGGLDAKAMPEQGKLVDSTLGYYIRAGKHSMTPEDWKVFLDFADKHFGKPEKAK